MSCLTPWNPIPGCNPGGMIALDGPPSGIVAWNGANKRWAIIMDDGTPPADLYFQRFSDGGALLGTPLTLNRLNGSATFAGPVILAADPKIPLEAATKQYVDRVAKTPSAMIAETLYYHATAAQTVFNLGTLDQSGNTGVLSLDAPVMVYANGNRMPLGDAYTVDVPHNTITFLYPLGLGDSVVFDVASIRPPPLTGPSAVEALYYHATAAQTVFNLGTPDQSGNTGVLSSTAPVMVYANGNRMPPGDAYTVNTSNNTITFLYPLGLGDSVVFDLASISPPSLIKMEALYYYAASAQTVFNLGTPDKSGNTGALSSTAPVTVYANGNRMPLGDAYTVDVPHNAIIFLYPLGLGDSVVFDLASISPPSLIKMEALTITQADTLPPLSYVPDGNVAIVFVNGSPFFAIGPNPAFTIAAGSNVLTWSSLSFAVPVGAAVIVEYTHA